MKKKIKKIAKFLEHCKTPKKHQKIFFLLKQKNQCFSYILT